MIYHIICNNIILIFRPGLVGLLFSDNKEPAFAALKMTQSVSNFTFFITSPYLCTRIKIIAVGVVLFFAVSGYITLEGILRRNKQPVLVIERKVKLIDEKEGKPEENAV